MTTPTICPECGEILEDYDIQVIEARSNGDSLIEVSCSECGEIAVLQGGERVAFIIRDLWGDCFRLVRCPWEDNPFTYLRADSPEELESLAVGVGFDPRLINSDYMEVE